MKPRVFLPESIADAGYELLAARVDCIAPWKDGRKPADDELRALLRTADAVIVRLFQIRRADLDLPNQLKVIAKHGVGVDNIDARAAAEKKIPVVYTPAANSNAVAEHTIALLLALARRIEPAAQAVKQGRFHDRTQFGGVEVAGKTLGIVGLGRIGWRVAAMAALGFGMRVVAYDPFVHAAPEGLPFTTASSVNDLLAVADFLSFHVPLTPETRHLIGPERIPLLKPGCRIVNTSRGAVIDEAALVHALESGQVAGAALDVYEQEPLPADHPLCTAPNVLLTPHISSSTKESLDRMAIDAAQGVLDVLEGREPTYPYRAGL